MKRPQLLAVLLILGLVAALGSWLYLETRPRGRTMQQAQPLPEGLMMIMDQGIRFSEIKGDKVSWTIEAVAIRYYQDEERITLDKPRVKMYPPEGGEVKVTGNSGEFFRLSGDMDLIGSVEGSSDLGYTMTTDRLHYSESEKTISTDAPVLIKSDDMSLNGKGLVFDIESQQLSISKGVRIKAKSGSWSKG